MSNLNNIKNKILSDANLEAQKIMDQAKMAAQAKTDEALGAAEAAAAETISRAKAQKTLIFERVQTQAQREMRDALLGAKQSVVDRAFEMAKATFKSLSDADFKAIVDRFLESHTPPADAVLEIPSGRSYATDKVEVRACDAVKNGFRLVRDDVSTNFEFDQVIDFLRDSIEADIADLITGR